MNSNSDRISLRNARIVSPEKLIERGAVLIHAGHIAEVSAPESSDRSSDVLELDLDGLTLFPGFIDVHIHGAAGIDTMEASASQLAEISQFLVTKGVTGWLPTLVPASQERYSQCISAVSLGHTRATPQVLESAFAAGARHMTHFMNAMAPLHHRTPGPVAWGLMRDDVSCDVVADGVHLAPLMLQLLLKVKGPQRLSLISDAIAAAGMGDGEYQIWGETIVVRNGRTSNAAGTIAGSVITMVDAVRMMLSLGVSEVDCATMASTNPARLLGVGGDCGSIEEGKRADLVAVDADGNVRLTIVGGNVAFQE